MGRLDQSVFCRFAPAMGVGGGGLIDKSVVNGGLLLYWRGSLCEDWGGASTGVYQAPTPVYRTMAVGMHSVLNYFIF
jgi:hypothetical protein